MADEQGELEVSIVSTDRKVYEGRATTVVFDTLDGQVGIMARHSPLMAVLRDAPVMIRTVEGDDVYAAVHGGFATVDDNKVIILGELAELGTEVDTADAEQVKAEIGTPDEDDERAKARLRKAEVRLEVAEKAGNSSSSAISV